MLDELQISEVDALTKHALAPLKCRRDIAMLGFLHRVAKKWAPNIFNDLVQHCAVPSFPRGLRAPERRHNLQLRDPCEGILSRQFNRSVFGLIYTYNLLPQLVVDAPIEIFQRFLQHALINAALKSMPFWNSLFTQGIRKLSVDSFQCLFK